ncbi:MAG: twin-arginine translocase TatA/TatE family subunit [Desertimonas sp.]
MFNLSGSEIVVILLLALVVLGPEKLPDALRRAGKTYAELRRMGTSFQREMRDVMDEPMREMRETTDLIRKSATFDADAAEAAAASSPTGAAGATAAEDAGAPEAPVTEPPVTEPPVTEPPVTEPPVSGADPA